MANKIQMVDLRTQYEGIAQELQSAFTEVLQSSAFINGPAVQHFQRELESFLGVDHVIPCANGTDALQIALMALDLEPGDEVIVPAFTFVASVEVIALLGYTPVVADVSLDTFNMEVSQLPALVSDRTRAIMPVHLFGQCCDMDVIMRFAHDHGLYVIEDNAQSIGAEYTGQDGQKRKAGTIGQIGTLSFYPSKNLGCYGDGGALMTNDPDLAATLRSICNHGMSTRYYHDRLGVNSRLDALQAAVLSTKLKRLDGYISARQLAAQYYDNRLGQLPQVEIPARFDHSTHVFHQYTLRIGDGRRDALKEFLASRDIPTMIYYPVPLQDQKAFGDIVRTPCALDNTVRLCKEVLSLPMHTELSDEQLGIICGAVEEFFAN